MYYMFVHSGTSWVTWHSAELCAVAMTGDVINCNISPHDAKTAFYSLRLTLFPLLTPTSKLPGPAPLKLRPYGAIQMSILLLLL